MLDFIVEFFKGIIDTITGLVDFVISLIEDIVYIIQLLGAFALNFTNYLDWLPSSCVVLLSTICAVVIIYKVLGREG